MKEKERSSKMRKGRGRTGVVRSDGEGARMGESRRKGEGVGG